MKWEQLVEVACELPEVEEGVWYRTPAVNLRGKSFCRLKEDGTSVVFLLEALDEQLFLIRSQPDVYFITEHYKNWPAVLARLSNLKRSECRTRLEEGFRLKAPRALVKEREGSRNEKASAKKTVKRSTRSK